MRRLSAALFPALIGAPAMAQQGAPWHGVWSAEPDWCLHASRIGSVTPAPIALTETEMLGYENSCDIVIADPVEGMNAWVLDMECHSEGDMYEERRLVMVDGTRLFMWYGIDEPIRFERCPL